METLTQSYNPEQSIRINLYSSSLLQYGYVTLYYLINQYQQEGNYEECKLILAVLQKYNQYQYFNLATDFDESAKESLKTSFSNLSANSDAALNNVPLYAEEVKKAIQFALNVRK
ncbi:hypothetical protein [Adhaeribacter aquaticus]|uniref:hypothetical protein n=1 Tax=Adhaeribacter aquaticus TaxID=299567 RepID=UPI000406A499|nr:hypothetical protein [Adhaeribacter aquaticus]